MMSWKEIDEDRTSVLICFCMFFDQPTRLN